MEKPEVKRHGLSNEASPTRQRQVRLTRQQRDDLVQHFHRGASRKELAKIYGIHAETVRAIIRRHDQRQ